MDILYLLKFDKNAEFECVEEAELYEYGAIPFYMSPERSRASVLFDSFTKHSHVARKAATQNRAG